MTSSEENTKIAWHVCIQWLEQQNKLKYVTEEMVLAEDRDNFIPYGPILRNAPQSFDFFNWQHVLGDWWTITGRPLERLNKDWQPIRRNLQKYLEG